MITAHSPNSLDRAIDELLKVLTQVYRMLRLEVNWKPGKTECFLCYKGPGSTKALEQRRVRPNGGLGVQVPGCPGVVISVVSTYRHLGGIIEADGSLVPDANAKIKSALSAYAPLA
eukprot:5769755-Karenia_brevis.AAC.1